MRTIILTEIISPYRIPVFNEITKVLKDGFKVIFLGESEKRRAWPVRKENIRFNYQVLHGFLFQKRQQAPYFFNPTLFFDLYRSSPEVIIVGGYQYPSYLLAVIYAKLFRRKIILWCESNRFSDSHNILLKEAYKRWFVRSCSGYIVPGKMSYEYLLSLGARSDKIWKAPNAVDNDYFHNSCDSKRENAGLFKESKGYPRKIILYIGHLIDEKGVSDLLKAFSLFSKERSDSGLLLIGSGKDEIKYREFCAANKINNVFFAGFIDQKELPAYYAIADLFILPTHKDTWGLVLNEAMACGLPVISSNAAGAAYDLIVPCENGYIFEKSNFEQLSNYLKDIFSDEQKSIAMGKKSFEIVQNYSPEKCAQGFIEAINGVKA
ncbi:MAG: glycosyltransferase family 4 protein [Candidatus Omnitrophica bacterium]|nr:glycosyltransferase family 4 protein [Candidatus Omnitrophota bacterium]